MSVTGTQPIRLMVVDDSAFMRKAISTMFTDCSDIEVVAIARDGLDAIQLATEHQPDVVTLDIEMPKMDGLTALRQIKRVCKARVIMVSSQTTEGSQVTLTALRMGADDFMAKPDSQISLDVGRIQTNLIDTVRALGTSRAVKTQGAGAVATTDLLALDPRDFDTVVIGASTGAPPVLEGILTQLPASFPLPIVIAQHMPPMFTKTMADRLDGMCHIGVEQIEGSHILKPGCAYLAQGGTHAEIKKRGSTEATVFNTDNPEDALYKPSVDVLFASAAESLGKRVLAIVLTGMGKDGLEGGRELQGKGATILAQDHGSCVVYGMPKAVTEAGLVKGNFNPGQFSELLRAMCPVAVGG